MGDCFSWKWAYDKYLIWMNCHVIQLPVLKESITNHLRLHIASSPYGLAENLYFIEKGQRVSSRHGRSISPDSTWSAGCPSEWRKLKIIGLLRSFDLWFDLRLGCCSFSCEWLHDKCYQVCLDYADIRSQHTSAALTINENFDKGARKAYAETWPNLTGRDRIMFIDVRKGS